MKKIYSYLKDSDFLLDFAKEKNKEQTVKITVLNFNEKPLKEIQGKVISGNININGSSAIRRTANLTAFIEERDVSYMEIGGVFSLNKKIKIELGITNNTKQYQEFPVIWFPLGTYVIMNLSSSHSTSGTTVTLQLKDKMVFLNGECGGTIAAAVDFHEYEILNPETGEYVLQRPTIVQIIKELVNHFGGESLERIIISDINTRIKKVMKWTGDKPLYKKGSIFTTEEQPGEDVEKIRTGEDVGYIYSDFYYPGELIGDAGSSVVTILDKIKSTLGNYEYFYDLDGNFIFQEIKNYLNTSKATVDLNEIKDKNQNITKSPFEISDNSNHYLINKKKGEASYIFDNSEIITSYSNSPQYANVKNDFVVWGVRETVDGKTLPIRYHLAIDEKPKIGNKYTCFSFKDKDGIKKVKYSLNFDSVSDFPKIGEPERLYAAASTKEEFKTYPVYKVFTWKPDEDYYIRTDNDYFNKLPLEQEWNSAKGVYENKIVQLEEIVDLVVEENSNIEFTEVKIDEETSFEDLFERIDSLDEELLNIEECLRETGQLQYETKKVDYYVTHYHPLLDEDGFFIQPTDFITKDWRTELYLSGAVGDRFGTDSNYYYTELVNEWPKLYDIENNDFYPETLAYPSELDYYLDFIDSSAEISNISVSNIGRRTKVINSNDINCIFEKEIFDLILIETGQKNTLDLISECEAKGQAYNLISSSIYAKLAPGGTHNSAYNEIRNLLYQYTSFNETISVQMIPLYFLDSNIRITVKDKQSGISGDYMINTISLPLDINGTMSLSCSKALERI